MSPSRAPGEQPAGQYRDAVSDSDDGSATDDDSRTSNKKGDDGELCAICALPALHGERGADARCEECTATGCALLAPPTVPNTLGRTLRDALVGASAKVALAGWSDQDERPERSLDANLRALSAAMLQATGQGGDQPPISELTALDVARAVCIGPALVATAGALGGANLSAPLARTVRLALLVCDDASVSATVAASRSASFSAAVERLRRAADAEALLTLTRLCSAVCAPHVLEVGAAALRKEARAWARAMSLACTNGDGMMHGAGCDCGVGGFL